MSKIYIEVRDGIVKNVYIDSQESLEVIMCDHDNAECENEYAVFGNENINSCKELDEIRGKIKHLY